MDLRPSGQTAHQSAGTGPLASGAQPPILSYRGNAFYRSGKQHRILAGAIHYFRVHPSQWEDRLAKLRAMGANTVDTYVAWNFHQPTRGQRPNFTHWRDLGRFIDLAAAQGLDVVVRPGPYICAEWDNGGIPAWLTGTPGIGLRCSDPVFTDAVEEWFDELLPIIATRQAARGGPVVAVQIENEYGSYGDDKAYLRWNRQALMDRGISELLFTADGGTDFYLDGGALDGTLAAATLGSRGEESAATWRRRRPDEPFFNVEFWGGWFDHWHEDHHVRNTEEAAAEVSKILDLDGSVCIYMAHGGTNFGLWSGSNHDGEKLQPTVTSYDSDAPIAENGDLTPKYHALRRAFFDAQGIVEPPGLDPALLAPAPVLPGRTLDVEPGAELLELLRAGARQRSSVRPLTFEEMDLDSGLMLYSAEVTLPGLPHAPTESRIRIMELHDRAHVWIDGRHAGILDGASAREGLGVQGTGAPVRLDILVENQGRINYGPLTGQGKGILGGVLVNQRHTFHWTQTPHPLSDWGAQELEHLASASFWTDAAADTFLALPGFGKGFVWINGFLLGRYWEVGPQSTLYVPAPLIRPGSNSIKILELEKWGNQIDLRAEPALGQTARP